jgi:hypothetical protein
VADQTKVSVSFQWFSDRSVRGAGTFLDLLHNSYVKCGIAVAALFGPGRGIACDNMQRTCTCYFV